MIDVPMGLVLFALTANCVPAETQLPEGLAPVVRLGDEKVAPRWVILLDPEGRWQLAYLDPDDQSKVCIVDEGELLDYQRGAIEPAGDPT